MKMYKKSVAVQYVQQVPFEITQYDSYLTNIGQPVFVENYM